MTDRKYFFSVINYLRNFYHTDRFQWLAIAVIPFFWLLIPCNADAVFASTKLDTCDTEIYHDFTYPPAHRLLVLYTLNLFKCTADASNFSMAVWINILAIWGLFAAIRKYFKEFHQIKINNWLILACILATPMLLTTKINIQTDLYAGILVFVWIMEIEKIKRNLPQRKVSLTESFLLALLVITAWNIKETAILPVICYILTIIYQDYKKIGQYLQSFWGLFLMVFLLLLFEMLVMKWQFGSYTFKYTNAWLRPHGNGKEYATALNSVPVPLYFYHIYEHLKVIGSHGLGGLFAILGSIYFFKKLFVARFFVISLVFMSVLGIYGNFTLCRYWFLFYFADVVLIYFCIQEIKGIKYGRYLSTVCVVCAILLSLGNYLYRYYSFF